MPKAPIDIRSLARSHSESAIRTLASIMSKENAPAAARVAAAQALLDRGFGKPDQHATVDIVKHGPTDWTRDELVAVIATAGRSGIAAEDGRDGETGSVH